MRIDTQPGIAANARPVPVPPHSVVTTEQPAYRYTLTLDPQARTLAGTANVTCVNTTSEPLNEVVFRAWGNAPQLAQRGASTVITNVQVNDAVAAAHLDRSVLRVPLSAPLAPGESTQVSFTVKTALPDSMGRTGTGRDGSLYFGHMLPVLAVHDDEGWNLDPYVEAGESFYSQSARWDVTVTAPADQQLITTGTQVASTTLGDQQTLRFRDTHARDFLVVAARDYAMQSRTVDGTNVRVWTPRDQAETGARMLDVAASSLAFYNARYGPYGRDEYDVIGVRGMGGGMEFPGIVLDDMRTSSGYLREVVAHETGHQWFYSNVGNNQFDDPWLDESFTSFITSEYLRSSPRRVAQALAPGFAQRTGIRFAPQPPVTNREPIRVSSPMHVLMRGDYFGKIYRDGAQVLANLKQEIGEDAFVRGMRSHIERNRDGFASTSGFISTMSEAAGRDLTAWFTQAGVSADEPHANDHLDPNGQI